MSSCGIRYEYQSSVLSSILSSNYEDSTREEGGEVEAYTEIQNENSNGNLDANNFAKNVKSEDESLFLLTPAINELLAYEPTGELSGRRRPIAPEVKNMFYLETQKFIISAKVWLDGDEKLI